MKKTRGRKSRDTVSLTLPKIMLAFSTTNKHLMVNNTHIFPLHVATDFLYYSLHFAFVINERCTSQWVLVKNKFA
jgi:hypothetical protein